MLQGRALSRSSPASALRTWSARSQPVRSLQPSPRHFSQAPTRSTLSRSVLGAPSRQIFSAGPRAAIGATALGVFAQRSGASRNLSLWPFSSKQQSPAEPQSAAPTTSTEASAPPTYTESSPKGSSLDTYNATPTPEVSAASPSYPVDASTTQYSLDSLNDVDMTPILDIPEQIGYLKNLGLDFGWGPTACCEWALEHIYIYTGMPWWAAIATMAVVWRAAIFYPTILGSKHAARAQLLHARPDFIKAKAEFDEAAWRTKDRVAMMRARSTMKVLQKEADTNMLMPFISFLTVPFSYGMFRLFRGMAAIPVPSLETGGLAWFTDLSVYDPYYILPMASIGLTVVLFQQTQAANIVKNPLMENIQMGMKYILPPMMFLCTAWLPAGIQWFFLVFSAGALVQSAATINAGFRRWADLPPLSSRNQGPLSPGNLSGATWQAPSPAPAQKPKAEAKDTGFSSMLGVNKQKEEWTKAQAYEERRAAEEEEKAYRRMEDIRRRRAEKERR
ncbi:60Kd inner membrane protein-domain-containing protein [Hypoxylon sp. FL1150]|nr:60Kd inner membrane protein-domain-containing protein [Hypoxylon sp. FL1150]